MLKLRKEDKKFLKGLGARINQIRKEKVLSFQEMADDCDMDKSNLVKITQGENITAVTLYKISKGIDIPLKTIFDFEY